MPLLRFLSAMARRLWLALVPLLASFFLRSCTVSRLWPCPLAPPTTVGELSGLCLQQTESKTFVTSSVPGIWKNQLTFSSPFFFFYYKRDLGQFRCL